MSQTREKWDSHIFSDFTDFSMLKFLEPLQTGVNSKTQKVVKLIEIHSIISIDKIQIPSFLPFINIDYRSFFQKLPGVYSESC